MTKVLLLAPKDVAGGIATWAKIFCQNARSVEIQVIDTARRGLHLGDRNWRKRIWHGAKSATRRIVIVTATCAAPRRRPDVVYLTCSPDLGLWLRDFALILLLRILQVPIVVHLHGGSASGFFGRSRLARFVSGTVYRRVAAVIAITRCVRDRALEIVSADRVHLIPNMLEAGDVALVQSVQCRPTSPNALRVLHVGWQAAEKGTFDVMAIAGVMQNMCFRLVGPISPSVRAAIEAVLVEQRQENVTFTGELFGPALKFEYESADIFLFPSHGEGFPMVILEAMKFALPIVATDVGAIKDILAPEGAPAAGIVIPMKSAAVDRTGIVRALGHLQADCGRRATLGETGRSRVTTEYTPSRIVPELERILLRAARSRGRVPR